LGTITFPYGTNNPVPEDMEAKWWHQFPDPAITMRQYTEVGQNANDSAVVWPDAYKTADPILTGQ
jgi:hypothetical protein